MDTLQDFAKRIDRLDGFGPVGDDAPGEGIVLLRSVSAEIRRIAWSPAYRAEARALAARADASAERIARATLDPPPAPRLTWHPGEDGATILCLDGTLIGGVAESIKHRRAVGWGWFLRGGGRHMVGTEQRPTRPEAMADLWACAEGYLGLAPAPAPAADAGGPPGDLPPGLAALCGVEGCQCSDFLGVRE